MATICLDSQVFYTPPVAAGPKPVSRSFLERNEDPSELTPLWSSRSPANGGTGTSQDDAVEILSDDNLDDDRSDTFSPPIDEVLAAAGSDVGIGGDDVDAPSGVGGNGNAMKPSVTGGADPDNESPSNQQRRTRSLGCSPDPFSVSPEALQTKQAQPDPADYAAGEPGQAPASDNTLCDSTVLETTGASLAEDRAERHRHGLKHDLQPSAEICGKTSDPAGTICRDNDEWDKRHPYSLKAIRRRLQARRANESTCNAAGPDQPKPVMDSHGRGQSLRTAASSLGVETQRPDSCGVSQHHDHREDSDQTSDAQRRHPPVPNDRLQNECSAVPPQAQQSGASTRMLPDDERISELELAITEPSIQPSPSQDRVGIQRDIRRRRHHDADNREDCRLIVGSDAEQSKDDEDIVRLPQSKRRRVNTATLTTGGTASQQQTRLYCGNSPSRGAQKSPRGTKGRRDRSIPNPLLSRGSNSERESETDRAPAAKFEEWSLGNAVLKRVTMDGSPPTFVVQFTWDPCTKHGMGYHGAEHRTSSAKRRRPVKQRSSRYIKDKETTPNPKPTSTSRREKYTPEDDAKIRQLKEQGLSWLAIAERFLGRTPGAIEVRYHTKLKRTNPSGSEAPQLFDCPRTASVVDDAGEEEWEVEEICDDRELYDGSVELLVKWQGGEETWEPYENVAETEALDKYERLHGLVK